MTKRFKFSIILACLSFAGGVLYTHTTNTLFPGLPIGVIVAAGILVAGSALNRTQTTIGVGTIICLAVVSRLFAYSFPASMMRFDPDSHAVRSQVIIDSGGLGRIVPGFYQTAAMFNVFGGEVALITNTPIDTAFAIFPIAVGLLLPLFAAIITRRVTTDTRAQTVAAAIVAVGGPSTMFGIAPIPITLAAIYLAGFIVMMLISDRQVGVASFVVFGLFTLAAALTHKVSILLLVGSTVIFTVYTGFVRYIDNRVPHSATTMITLFGILMLALQWLYLTEFFDRALVQIFKVIRLTNTSTALEANDPTMANVISRPLPIKLRNLSYFFITVGTGGLAAIELFRRYRDYEVRLLQAAAASTVGIALPSLIGPGPGFQRVYIFATVFVAALIGVGITRFACSGRPAARTIAASVILLIIVTNPLGITAMPDFPGEPREYLSDEEVEAKHFANNNIDQVVYMDMYYGDEVVNFERAARGDERHQQTVPQPRWEPGLLSSELTQGTLLEHNYEYIAYRTDVENWRLEGGRYRLTWKPERKLAADPSYHVVYSNDGVTIHSYSYKY